MNGESASPGRYAAFIVEAKAYMWILVTAVHSMSVPVCALATSLKMAFGQGSSTLPGHERSMKHSISELPVSWWIRPSVLRTFSSQGDLNMGTATPRSNVTFSPLQDGTSAELLAGVSAQIRENVTLGVQGGYARSVSGNGTEGYNGQASVKASF